MDKWLQLSGVAQLRASSNPQALRYIQQLKVPKPLRGCTPCSLDFVEEFPVLTRTYLQGEKNQVMDMQSRASCFSTRSRLTAPPCSPRLHCFQPPNFKASATGPVTREGHLPITARWQGFVLYRAGNRLRRSAVPVAACVLGTPNGEDWSPSYPRCSISCDPSTAAVAQAY